MKHWLLGIALICFGTIAHADPYFKTIVSDPTHPKISATALFTSKFSLDGAVSDVAIAYHKADSNDSLWPQSLIDAGFPPISWTLLELGAGGNTQTGFIHGGISINLAPTLLGPLVSGLNNSGGTAAKIASILSSPDGTGIKFGLGWKTNIVENGGFVQFDHMRFPPRYGVGYTYQF